MTKLKNTPKTNQIVEFEDFLAVMFISVLLKTLNLAKNINFAYHYNTDYVGTQFD